MTEEVCCPRFNPERWENKIIEWKDKKFLNDKVFTIFYIPLNFGQVMTRISGLVDISRVNGENVEEQIVLSEHTSPWNMDIYYEVKKGIPDAKTVTMSGKYFTKVYEGDFKDTGKWMEDFGKAAVEKGLKISKYFMWYTTCPKCAKKYGKNYTVVVGKIE